MDIEDKAQVSTEEAAADGRADYAEINPDVFTRAPFTLLGGRTRMENLFGGREKLSAILDELNQLIASA